MTKRVRRYPAQRLADHLHLTMWQMLDQIGVNRSTAASIRDRGFSEIQADRACTKLGLSPYEVWPELRDDIIAEESGLPEVTVLHAFVRCLECGRSLSFSQPRVAADGTHGAALGVCVEGHRNTMRVELEVA